jgi:hypothetical protein
VLRPTPCNSASGTRSSGACVKLSYFPTHKSALPFHLCRDPGGHVASGQQIECGLSGLRVHLGYDKLCTQNYFCTEAGCWCQLPGCLTLLLGLSSSDEYDELRLSRLRPPLRGGERETGFLAGGDLLRTRRGGGDRRPPRAGGGGDLHGRS